MVSRLSTVSSRTICTKLVLPAIPVPATRLPLVKRSASATASAGAAHVVATAGAGAAPAGASGSSVQTSERSGAAYGRTSLRRTCRPAALAGR